LQSQTTFVEIQPNVLADFGQPSSHLEIPEDKLG
jgi:hypothetical protein